MLKLVHESFSPHTIAPAGLAAADVLSRAGSALLENQPARTHALDVQHRKPAARAGTLSRKATRHQAVGNLDDPGFDYLVSLRGTRVGGVSHFNTRACRRAYRGT